MSVSAVMNYGLLSMYICPFTLFFIQRCFENIAGFDEGRRKQRLKTKSVKKNIHIVTKSKSLR